MANARINAPPLGASTVRSVEAADDTQPRRRGRLVQGIPTVRPTTSEEARHANALLLAHEQKFRSPNSVSGTFSPNLMKSSLPTKERVETITPTIGQFYLAHLANGDLPPWPLADRLLFTSTIAAGCLLWRCRQSWLMPSRPRF